MSAGHKNTLGFEINGSKGSLIFDLERMNELQVYFTDDGPRTEGFRTVMVTQSEHPYIGNWWPPGHIIGWEHGFIHQRPSGRHGARGAGWNSETELVPVLASDAVGILGGW